jgi:peptidoglycan-associated lipoprotein
MNRLIATLSATGIALALAGCGAKAPKQLPPPPQQGPSASNDGNAQPGAPVPGSQADFVASVMSDTIHFDTDKYDVLAQDQQVLMSQVAWLSKYPGKRVTIEGHCDERGTRDYNLALGERRANAAKTFLASHGVDASRITTVSYGKERPVAMGSDEGSWAKNRRAVTITVQ